jgi:hypothetical protein
MGCKKVLVQRVYHELATSDFQSDLNASRLRLNQQESSLAAPWSVLCLHSLYGCWG